MERQKELYADYLAGRGHLAALPGHSNHQSGHALDLAVSGPNVLAWLEAHAADFGFRRTVPKEPWHWET
jgi:LAS superfamily LD-carboxypeptidase LdcB